MKKVLLISLGGVCLVLLIAGAVWVFLPGRSVISSSQQTAELKKLLGRDPHLSADAVPTTWSTHKSSSIQFDYPSWAKIYTADNAKAMQSPHTLDSFSFNLLDDHLFCVVQAVQFSDSLDSYPGVNVRLSQSDIYTVSSGSAATSSSIQFSKEQDMTERSAFFLKNGKVVSVAVTGYSDIKVQDLYSRVVRSLIIF